MKTNNSNSIQNVKKNRKEKISNKILLLNNDNTYNIKNENELLIFNNSKLKKNIYSFLENELKINTTKIELRDCKNQILQIKKYNEFKNKIIIYFFSSIIILKYYNIISITSLSVLSLMNKIKIGNIYSLLVINNKQINLILDELWNISNQTSKNIFLNLSEIIIDNIDKIPLNEKYNKDKFIKLFENIYNDIREKCNFFIYLVKILKEKINNLENLFFHKNSLYNNNLSEYKLKFLYILCDIICSNLFYSSFVESYEQEIEIQMEEIKGFFREQNEKTFLAIVYDLDSYKNRQFLTIKNKDDLNINNDEIIQKENNDKILLNYQNCLKSIDI